MVFCATKSNDIMLFDYMRGVTSKTITAHDDTITAIMYYENRVFSVSRDQTIKIWDQRQKTQQTYNHDIPITIFDHSNYILAADILKSETEKDMKEPKLVSLDLDGKIYIRSIKLGQNPEQD